MSSVTSSATSTTMSSAPKTSKKSTKTTEAVAVAAPAPAPVAAAAPAKVSKKAAKAAEAAAAPAVAAPVAAVTEAPVAAVDEDLGASLQKSIAALQEQLNTLKAATHSALTSLKAIEKQSARLAKRADRRRKRSSPKAAGAEPKPCIFTKPVKITDELCAFLGKPKGTEISRSAVTKGVMAYAKAHNLMDKQTIKADAALRKLLTLSETDNLTILNLQKFLGRHYVKPAPVAN
jgi:chromatin remodeling complex protein RSC6